MTARVDLSAKPCEPVNVDLNLGWTVAWHVAFRYLMTSKDGTRQTGFSETGLQTTVRMLGDLRLNSIGYDGDHDVDDAARFLNPAVLSCSVRDYSGR